MQQNESVVRRALWDAVRRIENQLHIIAADLRFVGLGEGSVQFRVHAEREIFRLESERAEIKAFLMSGAAE